MSDSDFEPWFCKWCNAGPFTVDVGPDGWDLHWATCEKDPRPRYERDVRVVKQRAAAEERYEAVIRNAEARYRERLRKIRRNERIITGVVIAFAVLYLLAVCLIPVLAPLLHKSVTSG